LVIIAALGAPAGATEEDSKTFFAQGRKLRADGNCPDAIVAFRRALEAFPQGLGALRNIAECEEQLGQFASARNDWWSLRRAVLQSNEPKYEGWDKDAESAYARLASKVAKLTVRISGEGASAAHITIDGKPLDPRLLGVELERDLGLHTIEAAYGGVDPVGTVLSARSVAARVARGGAPVMVADFTSDPSTAPFVPPILRLYGPFAVVPFGTKERRLGALAVYRRRGHEPFGPATVDVLNSFAAQAGLALTERRRIGSQWLQHRLETAPTAADLLTLARLTEWPARYAAAWGETWYRRILAWHRWPLYQALGKLEGVLWVLRP